MRAIKRAITMFACGELGSPSSEILCDGLKILRKDTSFGSTD